MVYGQDPDPAPGDPETPYYVALDVEDNGQMTAYREIKSEDVVC